MQTFKRHFTNCQSAFITHSAANKTTSLSLETFPLYNIRIY